MNAIHVILSIVLLSTWLPNLQAGSQQDFEVRRNLFLGTTAQQTGHENLIAQAYLGMPLDEESLQQRMDQVLTDGTADFKIVQLIRILYFTEDWRDEILETLTKVPFWLEQGEIIRQYWSENHMIMWMSSSWLLHEKFGWAVSDPQLYKRLKKYLEVKVQYGFYEFFSPTYFPYTLTGLLNLADFAEDETVKSLAKQAAQRLLKETLLFVNDKGGYFPASGRSYFGKYRQGFHHNHSTLFYLLTGRGQSPERASHAAGFLATTSVPMESVIDSWQQSFSGSIYSGHPLKTPIYKEFNRFDRTIFQWSSGAYFHPDVAEDTAWLLNDLELWEHEAFEEYEIFSKFPNWVARFGSERVASISRSSVLSGSTVKLYKDNGVSLSSIQNYRKGRQGYQQWPWVAGADDLAVWTQSGEVKEQWKQRSGTIANSSLPFIEQKDNIALIMYKANLDLKLIARKDHSVSLYWPAGFDETRKSGHWIMGRQGRSYIAVYRHCDKKIKSFYACDDQQGQTWATIVGNESNYGGFDEFVQNVQTAVVTEEWKWNWRRLGYDYYGKIEYDNHRIEKLWR